MQGLSEQERKKLIIDLSIKIAPELIKHKNNSEGASTTIALYANDIADAVNSILKDPSGSGL